MINLDMINGEITELEAKTPTYATVERLAWLYIVRDHSTIGAAPERAENVIFYDGESDFAKAVNGRKTADIMRVLDELMSTLMAMQPRLYNMVMDMLK